MEGRSAVWLLAALLLEALISAQDQDSPQYLEVGGKLDLSPEPGLFSGSIKSISWKLSGSLVAVLDEGQPLIYNPGFGGRAKVDTTTGVLKIRNMMKNESGEYTVAINNKIQAKGYDVRVITQVPKPELKVTPETCPKEVKNCSLICKGDITDAGPVTFYFKKEYTYEDGDFEKEEGTTILIDEETQRVKRFSCRMENPLGPENSDPLDNPFYKFPTGDVVGVVVGVLLGVLGAVIGGVVYLKKRKTGSITTAASTKENGNQGEPLNDSSPDPKEA